MAGIDDIALYLPKCAFSIAELAEERNLEVAKLQKCLGLYEMRLPDLNEDVITMAAEALLDLMSKNPHIDPKSIGRIYVGTEYALDGSKPVASYLTGILNQYFIEKGMGKLEQCDAVDLVFACIGAVDAMQNCLYWLKEHPNKYAIVLATDFAKYELESPGEYTQGAGATAILLSTKPRLMEIPLQFASSTECIHDFFKPHRYKTVSNGQLDQDGLPLKKLETLFSECPIFDGPVSNNSYQSRMLEAYEYYKSDFGSSIKDWQKLVFHQPYAFHGRRMSAPLFLDGLEEDEKDILFKDLGIDKEYDERTLRKSEAFKDFVNAKLSDGEYASQKVENMYTASIFLCLISTLVQASKNNSLSEGDKIGFIAYGSGAKSKVFHSQLQTDWKTQTDNISLEKKLSSKTNIKYDDYKALHEKQLNQELSEIESKVHLNDMGITKTNYGSRNYKLAI